MGAPKMCGRQGKTSFPWLRKQKRKPALVRAFCGVGYIGFEPMTSCL